MSRPGYIGRSRWTRDFSYRIHLLLDQIPSLRRGRRDQFLKSSSNVGGRNCRVIGTRAAGSISSMEKAWSQMDPVHVGYSYNDNFPPNGLFSFDDMMQNKPR